MNDNQAQIEFEKHVQQPFTEIKTPIIDTLLGKKHDVIEERLLENYELIRNGIYPKKAKRR